MGSSSSSHVGLSFTICARRAAAHGRVGHAASGVVVAVAFAYMMFAERTAVCRRTAACRYIGGHVDPALAEVARTGVCIARLALGELTSVAVEARLAPARRRSGFGALAVAAAIAFLR